MAVILPSWTSLNPRLPRLVERFGPSICSPEPVFDDLNWVHITAAARVWNPQRAILKVWSAKNQRHQLPGAHGEGDFHLGSIARREAKRALALSSNSPLRGGKAVEVVGEEVAQYWNTPAHLHLEVVFEFSFGGSFDLPRGARWFKENP